MVIVNIIAVSFIGLIYITINENENQAGDYFRSFNKYALLVSNSGGEVSEEILTCYNELSVRISDMSLRQSEAAIMTPPKYTDNSSQEQYLEELRKNAAVVRANLSSAVRLSYVRTFAMLIVSIIMNIFLAMLMLIGRSSLQKYIGDMSSGLEYLKKVLKYENQPDFKRKESNIIEIEQLNEAIFNLSNDVGYNRKLIEKGIHGNLNLLLEDLFNSFRKRMPCDRIALAFIDSGGTLTAETAVTSYTHLHLEPGFRESLDSTSLNQLTMSLEARIINDLPSYAKEREVSKSTRLILSEGIKSSITAPMVFNGKCIGFLFVSSKEKDAYNTEMLNYSMRVLNLLKQKIYIEFLLQEVIAETSNSFVGLMEEKDNETSAHILRMSRYSYIIARSYHEHISPLSPRFMREILLFSPLHDIGKVGTPDAILLKKGPLDSGEMDIMKDHVDTGRRVIEKMNDRLFNIVSSPLMKTAVEIIAGHHEKYNGAGYPLGQKEGDIPLAGRIVALADVFDALTSKRPYKEAYSIEKALGIIETDMAGSFDPYVVRAFLHGMPEIKDTYDEFKEI
ncbi:MAG: HD domain-containing protein [Spirochaetales bacterium]|nr:HD domain-containing protein [Spirochaetales bacterium]